MGATILDPSSPVFLSGWLLRGGGEQGAVRVECAVPIPSETGSQAISGEMGERGEDGHGSGKGPPEADSCE